MVGGASAATVQFQREEAIVRLLQSVSAVVVAAALAAAGLVAVSTAAEAQSRVRWRVPIAFPSSLPALGDNMPWVAEQIGIASGNRIQLRVIEPGEMVPALELSEAVGQRQVVAGYNWLGYDQGRIPSSPLLSAVPFGMEPWEYTAWWYYGGGADLARGIYGKINVEPILCGVIGPETAGWFKTQITGLDDLNGLKIRFAGLGGSVLQELGASVSLIAGGEIFQALERGVIDASEFSLPVVDQRLGFDQIAKFNYFPGWHQTFTAFHLIVNKDEWNGLSDADRGLFNLACQAGVTNNIAKSEALQGPVIAGFPDKGVTPTRLPLEVLRQLETVTKQVLDAKAAEDEDFAEVYASQQEFKEHYQLWKEFGYLPRDF